MIKFDSKLKKLHLKGSDKNKLRIYSFTHLIRRSLCEYFFDS